MLVVVAAVQAQAAEAGEAGVVVLAAFQSEAVVAAELRHGLPRDSPRGVSR